jgi:hypothetical protein
LGRKGTLPLGKIELLLSLGATPNGRTMQVTFDIVDMVYPEREIGSNLFLNDFGG